MHKAAPCLDLGSLSEIRLVRGDALAGGGGGGPATFFYYYFVS